MAQERGSLDPVFFDTANAVFQWNPATANRLLVSTVPRASRIRRTPGVELLAGLDNGPWTYLPGFDARPQGGPLGNVYNFQHWQYVDAAYYYTHHLVSVPPVVWTNAAHRNGVKMYSAVTSDCDGCAGQFDLFFADPVKAAEQLFRLAATFGFDGWLIDVEGGASGGANVQAAMKLLRQRILPSGAIPEVGLYEGGVYTIDDETFPYFQAGSFFQSDYTQNAPIPGYPEQSYDYLKSKNEVDKRFATYWSVYTYQYNGAQQGLCNGFDCLDVDAFFTQLAQAKMSLPASGYFQSLGIYGPDWTMYGGHDSAKDPLPDRDKFHETDRLLWVGKNPVFSGQGTLRTDGPAVSNFIPARSSIIQLPFVTRFNTGEGSIFALAGQTVLSTDWNHLSSQDRLPTWLIPTVGADTGVTADYSYTEAFDGGSSLAFQGSLAPGKAVEFALFLTQVPLQSTTRALLHYLLRTPGSLLPLLRLEFGDGTTVTVPTTSGSGWLSAALSFPARPAPLIGISVGFQNSSSSTAPIDVVLGELRIVSVGPVPPPPILKPTNENGVLTWDVPTGLWSVWYYNVFAITSTGVHFLGRSVINGYDLSAPLFPATGIVQGYRVQPVATTGEYSSLSGEQE